MISDSGFNGAFENCWILLISACDFSARQILLNEVAPRPHNSGHHTIESCYTSQYEQHLRAVVGLPLGDPSMKTPAAIMYNLLGEDEVEFLFIFSLHFRHPTLSLFFFFPPLCLLALHVGRNKRNERVNVFFLSNDSASLFLYC